MIKKLLFSKNKLIFYKVMFLLAVISSFPLFGSDCSNNIIGGGTTGELVGSWQLSSMTGYLQDVCERETVRYDSNGTATLQCPNANPITRTYTVSNSILTYTETGIAYDISTLTTTTLVLTGRNVGRTLTYTKIPADSKGILILKDSKAVRNSSEYQLKKEF